MTDSINERTGLDGAAPEITAEQVKTGIANVKLEDELRKSFIDYAMSVIVDRALPDVRDGLKPVHRRVLFDMYDLKIGSGGQTKKSARVVGDVIGRFHPHGDAAVYETIVRMAQWFSMREPLIFGQGNFGNIDGDGAAAMRYTEVKMTKIAEMMLQDIDKETVDTYKNYDGNEDIPWVLPTRFPNLLVNGSQGIAVGMATNIPTHNLGEVINGSIALLDNPNLTLPELMHFIPGPDFPTGGYIVGRGGIAEAYRTGRGRCIMRARTHVEEDKSGRKSIIVDEIPYMVSKSSIVKQIAELVRDKKLEGIAEVNDLSDKDHEVRIAIDLKRGAYEEAVLNNLYESTAMQSTFAINMIALVNNKPRQLSLLEILREFLKFRREVVTRRTVFLLRKARSKAFLDEGLIIAKSNIEKIVSLITTAKDREEAAALLMKEAWDGTLLNTMIVRDENGNNICTPSGISPEVGIHGNVYFLDRRQADAILSMQLSRMTHLAGDELKLDYQGLIKDIQSYLEILNDPEQMKRVIRTELQEVSAQFPGKRRSEFIADEGEFNKADLIAKQDVVITLSAQGYIKYMDVASYDTQHRGGKGRLAAKLKDEDYLSKVVVANTHDCMMFFTNLGRVFAATVYDLPTSDNRAWRGRPIQNLFKIEENEKVTAMLPISSFDEEQYIFMATAMGMVKKTALSAFKGLLSRQNDQAVKALTLQDGDQLVGTELSGGDDDIYLFTSNGRAIRFCEYYESRGEEQDENAESNESEDNSEDQNQAFDRHRGSGVRPSGRGSGTIRGIKLLNGAQVVSLLIAAPDETDPECLIACANGYGKRMLMTDISFRNRGGQGILVTSNLERNGAVIGAGRVDEQSNYLLITDQGQLVRSPLAGIAVLSRMAAGIILMRPGEGEQVIALQTIPEDVVAAAHKITQARHLERREEQAALQAAEAASNQAAEKGDLQ